MSIGIREFQTIAGAYGLEQAERCAAGQCTHPHPGGPGGFGGTGGEAVMADLRCPDDMPKLLGRARATTRPDGQIELACGNCARRYRSAGIACSRVLHRFNLLGELLGTELTPG